MAWILATSSSLGGTWPEAYWRISRSSSRSDSAVLSICTGAKAIHGRWPSAPEVKL